MRRHSRSALGRFRRAFGHNPIKVVELGVTRGVTWLRVFSWGVAMGRQFELPPAIAEVFITEELHRRSSAAPDYLREKLAIQDLAHRMADQPAEILPQLVNLAMEICQADSAGISLYEAATAEFRWAYLVGKLASFEGARTPRGFSPCGICLDHRSPVLMQRPERAYQWIADAGISVPEVLLVPLYINGETPLGTLWIVAKDHQNFDGGHARVMTELAGFSGVALRMIQTEERLKLALEAQETLTREMSHRVKNLFAITDSMIRISARNSSTKEEMAESLSGRVHALANANALVRRSFGPENEGTDFADLIKTVLKPYDRTTAELEGPHVKLGDKATNSLALVFHELATNAAKYGALSVDAGMVKVAWSMQDGVLSINWQEFGGPRIDAIPQKKGFGSQLAESTITRQGGTLDFEWIPTGVKVAMSVTLANLSR